MKGDVCSLCNGFGEAQVLSEPSNPESGSYELVSCPGCNGKGLENDSLSALALAIDCVERAVIRSGAV
jgi:hypothetical protein